MITSLQLFLSNSGTNVWMFDLFRAVCSLHVAVLVLVCWVFPLMMVLSRLVQAGLIICARHDNEMNQLIKFTDVTVMTWRQNLNTHEVTCPRVMVHGHMHGCTSVCVCVPLCVCVCVCVCVFVNHFKGNESEEIVLSSHTPGTGQK